MWGQCLFCRCTILTCDWTLSCWKNRKGKHLTSMHEMKQMLWGKVEEREKASSHQESISISRVGQESVFRVRKPLGMGSHLMERIFLFHGWQQLLCSVWMCAIIYCLLCHLNDCDTYLVGTCCTSWTWISISWVTLHGRRTLLSSPCAHPAL